MAQKILLIEDKENHLADAKKVLEDRVSCGVLERYDFSTNLKDAQKLLKANSYRGILSDVFFPRKNGGIEEQFGTTIGEYAISRGVPYVLVTSTHHHGQKTEPVCRWAREHGTQLVDAQPLKNSFEGEAGKKNWKGAFMALSYLMALEERTIDISKEEYPEDVMIHVFRFAESLNPETEYPGITTMSKEEYSQLLKKKVPSIQIVLDKYCSGMF